MLIKLSEFSNSNKYKSEWLSNWGAKSALQRFLARRCSKEFLSLYLKENPELLTKVSEPGIYLYAVSEVDLAERLHEFKLLPEEYRKRFVATVSEYAVRGVDLYALDDLDIRSLFEDHEFEELVENVRTQLIPNLADVRIEEELNYENSDPPEEHMQQLLESFDILERLFGDDLDAGKIIERERNDVNEWIAENEPEEPETKPRILGNVETSDKMPSTRSIFDDIDV